MRNSLFLFLSVFLLLGFRASAQDKPAPTSNSKPNGSTPLTKATEAKPSQARHAPVLAQTEISGQVMGKHGAVVPGVRIEATNTETKQVFPAVSGPDGTYRLPVPIGHYSIQYMAKDLNPKKVETDAFIGVQTDLNVNIYESNGEIKVHVNDADGHDAADIGVLFTRILDDERYLGTTDKQGDCVQGALAGGTYRVLASAGNKPCKKVTIDDGQRKAVTLKLSESCR